LNSRGIPIGGRMPRQAAWACLPPPSPTSSRRSNARTRGRSKASPDFTGYGDGFTETLYQVRDRARLERSRCGVACARHPRTSRPPVAISSRWPTAIARTAPPSTAA
jgi:hypothetical protein